MRILTAAQMRLMDRRTTEGCGISFRALMENAGRRVVEAIVDEYGTPAGKRFAVVCGRGNNGGDGAVIARLLSEQGASAVAVYLAGSLEETKGEAGENFAAISVLANQGGDGAKGLSLTEVNTEALEGHLDLTSFDFVVDALLGSGIDRPATGQYAAVIEAINRSRSNARVISVDIPSGLASDSVNPIGHNVIADLTVTFTSPKPANVLPPACEANGKLIVAAIGTPANLIAAEAGSWLELLEGRQVSLWLDSSRRRETAHKATVGNVLLIAGSPGKSGAAALAAEAVLRSGAGLVTVATSPAALNLLVSQSLPEVMTTSLPETEQGLISDIALDSAIALSLGRQVVAIGPGLSSTDSRTRSFVLAFVKACPCPLVIDADGLNALSPWPGDLVAQPGRPVIVTPHPGEMGRLTGRSASDVARDRVSVARDFAIKHGAITVVKGSRTVVAAPNGDVYINPTGNAGMATAGAGDVLTGLISGFLAQKPDDPLDAVLAGVYIHGLAGDLAAAELGLRSMIASDITRHISGAITKLEPQVRG